jgi:hypothetical protein
VDDDLSDALADLKTAIESQMKLQQQTNELLRALISVPQASGQATADLVEIIGQLGPVDEIKGPN